MAPYFSGLTVRTPDARVLGFQSSTIYNKSNISEDAKGLHSCKPIPLASCCLFYAISHGFLWFPLISYSVVWFKLISLDFVWLHIFLYGWHWFHLSCPDFKRSLVMQIDFVWVPLISNFLLWFKLISFEFPWFHTTMIRMNKDLNVSFPDRKIHQQIFP